LKRISKAITTVTALARNKPYSFKNSIAALSVQ
jgi:hypothetical protein